MEAVFAANSVDEAAFPTVLDLLDLHAFDFAKVCQTSLVKTPHATRPPVSCTFPCDLPSPTTPPIQVIESFVKTEPRLPHHLRAHFADVERRLRQKEARIAKAAKELKEAARLKEIGREAW